MSQVCSIYLSGKAPATAPLRTAPGYGRTGLEFDVSDSMPPEWRPRFGHKASIPIPERVALRAYNAWLVDESGCYISTYSVASHGYAQIGWGRPDSGKSTMTTAHRAAWVHVHGQIPDGMTIDHLPTCVRPCVNVDHLRMLPNFENARRTSGRDWPLGECINGHPNTDLYKQASGRVRCRPCTQEKGRQAYLDKKANLHKRPAA